MTKHSQSALFPALLKFWRAHSGLSQLHLGHRAGVSARHISFLETGRSRPSRSMVLILGAALEVPLRKQNALLLAAGYSEEFGEPTIEELLNGPIGDAIVRMLAQHEPLPMLVFDRHYKVLRANNSAMRILGMFTARPEKLVWPPNMYHAIFDSNLVRPFVVDWLSVIKELMRRLHHEALRAPQDDVLANLIQDLLAYPDVPGELSQPDFSNASSAVLGMTFARNGLELSFISTLTRFSSPQNVTTEELLIESFFPANDVTAAYFHNS